MIQKIVSLKLKTVAEVLPLKQGLKHRSNAHRLSRHNNVAEVLPLKQGLKQRYALSGSKITPCSRGSSIKTRIET